ncbi:MAG: GTPase Era [Bacteroidia bacterium]|jgi:GTP-binding protein Era
MAFKSGFVNIIGKPNAGKSTLMNALIGERLSITTPKAQTTRHRIIGILNIPEEAQIVFSDTPGIIKNPAYKLQESMNAFIEGSFEDADVFLYVSEIKDQPRSEDVPEKVLQSETPFVLALNKIEQSNQQELEQKVEAWKALIPRAIIVPVSAEQKFNLEQLLKQILHYLPENRPYFDLDALTDRNERFFVTEIIREKILLNYQKEIPYATEVVVEDFKEESQINKIRATIYVMRESQKGIIIGHMGSTIKKVSTEARIDMERFLGKKVYLELQVKVSKDWRDNEKQLKRFGYLH